MRGSESESPSREREKDAPTYDLRPNVNLDNEERVVKTGDRVKSG